MPQRRHGRPARRYTCRPGRPVSSACLHQLPRSGDRIAQRLVAGLAHAQPGRDADRPERLGHPHVPDPGDEPLVLERLAQPQVPGPAQPRHDRVEIDLGREHVLAEPAQVSRLEREDGPVPEHALELVAAKHEPRESSARLPARLDPPAAGHPQVAADDDPALEAKQQVLPDGFDRLEHAAVDPRRDAGRLGAGMRRLHLEPLADERLEPHRSAVERVALGHAARVAGG